MQKTGFDAYDNAMDITRAIKPLVTIVQRRDPKLADEARRSTQSIGLNIREARKRSGKDRQHAFKLALGSADETRGALDQAEAWDYLTAEQTAPVQALLDREVAMLWRLAGY